MASNNNALGAWPRWVSLVVAVWVFISAFVWPHTHAEQTNTWILGVLMAVASLWAMGTPPVRYLNTIFSIWLFIATLVIAHQQPGTLWSNLIAAVIVFVMSLIPSGAATLRTGTRQPLHA